MLIISNDVRKRGFYDIFKTLLEKVQVTPKSFYKQEIITIFVLRA